MTQPAALPRTRRRLWIAFGALGLGVALALALYVFVDRADKIDGDPAGTRACNHLADWIGGELTDPATGKPLTKVLAAGVLGDEAAASSTAEIKAAAGMDLTQDPSIGGALGGAVPGSLRFANLPAMRDACVAAGLRMPLYAEPASG